MKAIRYFLLTLASISFFACVPTGLENEENDEVNVNFTVSVQSVTDVTAEILVKHDGKPGQTWAYVVTKDKDATALSLADVAAAGLEDSNLIAGVVKTITVDNLETETDYRFIAFGVDIEKLQVVGTPGEVSFTTAEDKNVTFVLSEPVIARNNVSFTVSYEKTADFKWYGFLTEDLQSSTAILINSNTRNLKDSDLITGKDVEISLEGLDFDKTYRYIVTGYDGEPYGTPADITFTTGEQFYLSESWKLTYSGKGFRAALGVWNNIVKIENFNGGLYDIITVTKEDFTAAGVSALIQEEYALLADDVAYYLENYGADYGWDYLAFTQAGSFWQPYSGPDTYISLIYGIDPENEYQLSGEYALVEFTVGASATSSEYEAWLGTWVTSGQVWEIEEAVPGEQYAIWGINGYTDVPFYASFYGGQLYFCEQVTNSTVYVNDDLCNYAIWGMFSDNTEYWGGNKPIFIGTLNGDSASLAAQNINATRGDFTGFQVMRPAVSGSGTYYGNRVTYEVPNTLSRPSESASEGYTKWLGEYDVVGINGTGDADSTYFSIKIKPDVNDISFQLSGWGGYGEYEDWMYATPGYNAEDESLNILAGDAPSVANAVNVNFGDGALSAVYMMGLIPYNGGYARITGDAKTVATLTQDASGKISVTPAQFDNSDVQADYDLILLAQYHGGFNDAGQWENGNFVTWICDAPYLHEIKFVKTADYSDPASAIKKSLSFKNGKKISATVVPLREGAKLSEAGTRLPSDAARALQTPAKANAAL